MINSHLHSQTGVNGFLRKRLWPRILADYSYMYLSVLILPDECSYVSSASEFVECGHFAGYKTSLPNCVSENGINVPRQTCNVTRKKSTLVGAYWGQASLLLKYKRLTKLNGNYLKIQSQLRSI